MRIARKGHCMRPGEKPIIVAIVGGSGAGKTWLADRLQRCFAADASRVCLDSFYRDRSHLPPSRRAMVNYDHPGAIDWTSVAKFLERARAGKSVRIPDYDFKTHTCRGSIVWKPTPVILFEGLWLLCKPEVRKRFHFSVFLDAPANLRLQWRLARDVAERGRTASSIRHQFRTQVAPMHKCHVATQKRWANIVVRQVIGKREVDQLAGQICKLRQNCSFGGWGKK